MSDSENVDEKLSQPGIMDSEEGMKGPKFEQIIVDENEDSSSSTMECDDPTGDPLANDSNSIRAYMREQLEKELARRYRKKILEKIDESNGENRQITKNTPSIARSTRDYEMRRKRNQKYYKLHRDEINSRRRENRLVEKKIDLQSTDDVPSDVPVNARVNIEDRERRKKELYQIRQIRYREKHREKINQRQKDYRGIISIAKQKTSGNASVIEDREERKKEIQKECQRRYREKNREKINEQQKKYKQLVSYLQQSTSIQYLDTPNNDKDVRKDERT